MKWLHISTHLVRNNLLRIIVWYGKRAEEFAEEFGCGAAGNFCGILHDIGKYSKQFQERIRNPENTKKVDHSTAGALEALHISNYNIPFSMVIAGHHSGLMDGGSYRFSGEETGTFLDG